MKKYGLFALKRLLYGLIVLFGASILVFLLLRLSPSSPAAMMLPESATEEQIMAMEAKLGLDKPLYVQYLVFIGNALKGDLGTSIGYNRNCVELIMGRLPATAVLTFCAVFLSLLISFPLGIASGVNKGSAIDVASMFLAIIGQSVSQILLGLVMILVFAVHLKIFPSQYIEGNPVSVVMPAITMGLALTAAVTRQLRSSMFDTLEEDYVAATLARGISRKKVYFKYALRNALLPVVTVVGGQIGVLLCGSVVIENLFGWPGIGNLLVRAVGMRDYPLVQAIILLSAVIFVCVNIVVDIVYALIDPRMQID